MKFVTYSEAFWKPLHQAFLTSFSDYPVPFQLTEEEFSIRIRNKLHVTPALSVLAVEQDIVAGFILHTLNLYKGSTTAYNGGTGVVPGNRQVGLAIGMFEYIWPVIGKYAARSVLEVITTNKKAIGLYEKLGFRRVQRYQCFKKIAGSSRISEQVEVRDCQLWNPAKYREFRDFDPSFMDSDLQIPHNFLNERLLEAYVEGELAGYVIFQPATGRISQLAVGPAWRGHYVGSTLVRAAEEDCGGKRLSVLNVPEEESGMILFLEKAGFENQVDQYEMEKVI